MKQDWLYRSGDLFLPPKYVNLLDTYIVGTDTSVFYINYWTFLHFLSGVFLVWLTPYPDHYALQFVIVHTIWEMWQIAIGMTPMNLRGFLDILMDTIAGMVGVYVTLHFVRQE